MRKRQKLDAATPEPGDDPADDASNGDAARADDDSGTENSDDDDDEGDVDEDDAHEDDNADDDLDEDSGDVDDPDDDGNLGFSSPGTMAGAPVDDHTPAWGGRQLAEAIEAERKVAKLKRSTAGANGLSGSAAVLARLEAFDQLGVAAFVIDGPTEDSIDATPDSGVRAAASRAPSNTNGRELAPPSTDDRPTISDTEEPGPNVLAAARIGAAEHDEAGSDGSPSDQQQADRATDATADDDSDSDEVSPAAEPDLAISASELASAEEATNSFAAWEASVATAGGDHTVGNTDDDGPSAARNRPKGWLSNSRELTIVVPAKRGANGDSSTPARARRPALPDDQPSSDTQDGSRSGADGRAGTGWTTSSGDALAGALVGGAATVPEARGRSGVPGQATGEDTNARTRPTEVDAPGRNGRADADDRSPWHDLGRFDEHRDDDYYDDDYDPDRDDHPPVHGGHRWFRRQIRNYGPLLGLVPMALFGVLAWAGQQFSSNGSVAGLSIGLGAAAAPFLMIAGLPFGSSESYRIAVVASIVIWLGIGWWASRRALAEPMPTWKTFFHQLLWLSLALGGGVLVAYTIALRALG